MFTGTMPKTGRDGCERVLRKSGIGMLSIEESPPRLEDSFIEIISREEAQ